MRTHFKIIIAAAAAPLLAACGGGEENAEETEAAAAPAPVIEPWGYPLDAFNPDIRPGDDFFQYANGGWLAATPIPSDRSGTGFSITMSDRNDQRIGAIISSLSTGDASQVPDGQKISDLYQSFMDADRVESLGIAPIEADLERLRTLANHDDVAAALFDPALNIGGPFDLQVWIDSKSPTEFTVYAGHDGLGLPDKSYYLRESERLNTIRTAYRDFIAEMLDLVDEENTAARAEAVFALETAIAERHWDRADRRNADRTYNPLTPAELAETAPDFPWAIALDTRGLGGADTLVVQELDAFPALAELFAETPVETWRDYALFHFLSSNASFLPERFDAANFAFYRQTLRGQAEPRARHKRGVDLVNQTLNQAVGRLYIDRFFPEESKALMTEMFEDIRTALSIRIDGLEWMTDETKVAAQRKLAAMTAKIAYPEKWRDYSALEIAPDDLIGNVMRARIEDAAHDAARLGAAVDKDEWFSGPQTINAFYSPTRNEAFIPAGYIQSPLFDPNADAAINYGAIGSIIGHEIGHGFDDQGSKYDYDGTLRSWWTEDDRAAFDALGDRLAAQFDQYEPLPGLNVNGRQTLGENIGDLAGVLLAYHAYQLSLDGEPSPVLDGFTGEQRVFLGRAQARRFKRTEDSLRQRILSGVHSPMNLRVNGMVRNIDEWYEAFDVQPGDEMYLAPEDRVKIW